MSFLFKSFDERFDEQLKTIIHQGDRTQAYRNLIRKIVKFHCEYWTEENMPTTQGYLQELLDDAIESEFQTDIICGLLDKIRERTEKKPEQQLKFLNKLKTIFKE